MVPWSSGRSFYEPVLFRSENPVKEGSEGFGKHNSSAMACCFGAQATDDREPPPNPKPSKGPGPLVMRAGPGLVNQAGPPPAGLPSPGKSSRSVEGERGPSLDESGNRGLLLPRLPNRKQNVSSGVGHSQNGLTDMEEVGGYVRPGFQMESANGSTTGGSGPPPDDDFRSLLNKHDARMQETAAENASASARPPSSEDRNANGQGGGGSEQRAGNNARNGKQVAALPRVVSSSGSVAGLSDSATSDSSAAHKVSSSVRGKWLERQEASPWDGLSELDFYRQNSKRLAELRVFSFAELRTATRSFANELMLGIGGFGSVYKGLIKPVNAKGATSKQLKARMIEVAIKRLDAKSLQGHKEWMTEVSILGLFEHPHLVKLVGYCAEQEKRLLVYEYMPNTSLDRFIFGDELPPLDWDTRLQVALGTARGLAYLHEEVEPSIIYRDFKTSNVLLDEDFVAKLSDFGLAREGPSGDETHVSTQVRGTAGYAAPEYVLTGHLTPKNDVWSFGVVLLELLTGRPCLDKRRPVKEQNLVHTCRPYLHAPSKFCKIMDPRLENQFPPRAVVKAAELAKWCLAQDPNQRPLMSEVVVLLNFLQTLEEPGGPGGRNWGTRK